MGNHLGSSPIVSTNVVVPMWKLARNFDDVYPAFLELLLWCCLKRVVEKTTKQTLDKLGHIECPQHKLLQTKPETLCISRYQKPFTDRLFVLFRKFRLQQISLRALEESIGNQLSQIWSTLRNKQPSSLKCVLINIDISHAFRQYRVC